VFDFLKEVGQKVLRAVLGEAKANAIAINLLVNKTRNRPHPWSTRNSYISWSGLTDKTFNARLLPDWSWPGASRPNEPDPAKVVELFLAGSDGQRECPKSTCLFPAFAQYLTDGFLRTQMSNDPAQEDRRKTTSNHGIDKSALYGRNEAQTRCLRLRSSTRGERGRLKSQTAADGEEWSPFLYDDAGNVKADFLDESGQPILDEPLGVTNPWAKKQTIFAAGGDRVNAAPQTAMMNTLFLREHNRMAGVIEAKHPEWEDEQVFQTARNVLIVMFIKVVVEEYINHINTSGFQLRALPEVAWTADWNRPNFMTTEFTLLYRWHSLVPQTMRWNGEPIDGKKLLLDNSQLLKAGLAGAFVDQSANNATVLGLGNAADFMAEAELKAIQQGRLNRVQSYAAYRRTMNMDVPETFTDLVGGGTDARDTERRAALAQKMEELYTSVEQLEYYTGMFAEPRSANGPLPPLITAMVAVDAFSQALTNPLLSEHVWGNAENRLAAFTKEGLESIESTETVRDILTRCSTGLGSRFVGMTRADWARE
jgi:prostaglandin-endoperoxide synthase 2